MIITNQVPSTKLVISKLIKNFKLNPNYHWTFKCLNNFIGQNHCHIKMRKTRYQSINTTKNTLKGIDYIYNLYKNRSLQTY